MENVEAIYPLSPMQEGILYHVLAAPRSGVFHEQIHFQIAGRLQEEAWFESWRRVVHRHEALRAAFFWDGLDRPVQVIRSEVNLPVLREDWRDTDGPGQRRRLEAFLEADRAEGFALDQAPLVRLSLFRLDDTRWRFVWSFQHLLTDGWSTPRILSEVWAFYARHTGGSAFPIKAAPRYGTYLDWLEKRDAAPSEAFWQHRLADFSTPTPSPGARHARPGSAARRHELEVDVPPELAQSLADFARSRRITVSTLFQAAWGLLLGRYADQEDVCFGVTVSGRPPELPGVDEMVGLFINTIPLRLKVDEDADAGDFLSAVQRTFVEAMDHQVTPLPAIQRVAGTGPGRALFESILVFENYPEPPDPGATIADPASAPSGSSTAAAVADSSRLTTSDVRYIEQSNFPLALLVVPGASMRWIFVTDAARIDPEITRRLARHLRNLLEGLVRHPERPVRELSLFDEGEFRALTRGPLLESRIPRSAPDTDVVPDVVTQIERVAREQPHRVAVADASGARLTYAELIRAADRVAAALRDNGIRPGDPVGLLARRSAGLLCGMMGILRAGGAYVPLDAAYPAHRLRHMVRDSGARFLVADPALEPPGSDDATVPGPAVLPLSIEPVAAPTTGPYTRPSLSPDTPAYIIYTSGSTGTPKGVRVSHGSLAGSTAARSSVYETNPRRFLLLSSFAFDSSVAGIFWTLTSGGLVFVAPERIEQDLEALAALFRRERITHTLLLPSVYRALLSSRWVDSLARNELGDAAPGDDAEDRLSTIIVAGEACPTDVVRRHVQALRHVALYNEYGPTEGTVWCAVHRVREEDAAGSVPIGSAVPGYALYVVDRRLRPVPHGASGELLVGGDLLADGYAGDAALTNERFVPDPFRGQGRVYRTGDLVRRRPDGLLEFVGRLDGQVKIRGFRIEPAEIASALLDYPDVREAVAVVRREEPGTAGAGSGGQENRPSGRPSLEVPYAAGGAHWPASQGDMPGGMRLVTYAAARSLRDTAPLLTFLRSRLPEHMVPSDIVLLDSLPRLPNGKIDTASLPDPGRLADRPERSRVAPRNEPEARLHAIWADVLGVTDFGVTDDFYRIGGDSILSIHVISRARDAGFTFTPAEFFEGRTIDRLAAYYGQSPAHPALEPGAGPASTSGPVPLSPIQHWFFEAHPTDPHHWGQTLDLEWTAHPDDGAPSTPEGALPATAEPSFDPVRRVRTALAALLDRHEALRLRFLREAGAAWRAEIAPPGLEAPLDVMPWPVSEADRSAQRYGEANTDVEIEPARYPEPGRSESASGTSGAFEAGAEDKLEARIDDWVGAAQAGMRLDDPPLLRALLVARHEGPMRLVLAVHHLVVDAVSWSLLVEDLRRLLHAGSPPPGADGTSYATWCRTLASTAEEQEIRDEIPFWTSQQENETFPGPAPDADPPREGDIAYHSLQLDPMLTASFLGDANLAYRTRPVDLFLAAFVRAWNLTTGAPSITPFLEGHGRDREPAGLDLARTVGWLTTFYPLRLDMPADGTIRSLIRDTKERLRAVPNGGLGYGLLRYLAGAEGVGNRASSGIVLNYLGRIDHGWDAGQGLRVRGFRVPGARGTRVERGHPIEVNGWVAHARLHVHVGFSIRHLAADSIRRLGVHFEESLRLIVAQCLQTDESGYTPSDFPDVDLSQDDLDALLGDLG